MRRTKDRSAERALLLDTSQYGDSPLSFAKIFGNDNPVEIEIGCGKAKLLIARAHNHPDRNFIGIDYTWRFMRIGCLRSHKRQLKNIIFIKEDAKRVIADYVLGGSVAIFHIYFPDPWPKRRHRKRRLLVGPFIEMLHDRLEEGGRVEVVTDDFDYSIAIRAAFAETVDLWRDIRQSTNEPLFEAEERTNYEVKWRAAGRMIYYLEAIK
jgi:tRNA (guanine-N7-)-methyltransferase